MRHVLADKGGQVTCYLKLLQRQLCPASPKPVSQLDANSEIRQSLGQSLCDTRKNTHHAHTQGIVAPCQNTRLHVQPTHPAPIMGGLIAHIMGRVARMCLPRAGHNREQCTQPAQCQTAPCSVGTRKTDQLAKQLAVHPDLHNYGHFQALTASPNAS